MYQKVLHSAVLAALLFIAPYGYGQDTYTPTPNNNLGNILNILVGAYNGAAKAAAENNGTAAQTINSDDLQPLENTLVRYQSELQSMVKPDGEVDTLRLGHFLNHLQQENQGTVNYDFAQAFQVLNGVNLENNPQHFLNPQLINELVAAAKNQSLKSELNQVAPYIGAILQLGGLMNQKTNWDEESAALSEEVNALKALATRYQIQPDLVEDVEIAAAQLKVLYASQALGEPLNSEAINAVQSQLARLEQRILRVQPQALPIDMYDKILRPLTALGDPFIVQRNQWLTLRAMSQQKPHNIVVENSFDAPTRKLLDALNYDGLPAHVQQELLKRLNISRID